MAGGYYAKPCIIGDMPLLEMPRDVRISRGVLNDVAGDYSSSHIWNIGLGDQRHPSQGVPESSVSSG